MKRHHLPLVLGGLVAVGLKARHHAVHGGPHAHGRQRPSAHDRERFRAHVEERLTAWHDRQHGVTGDPVEV